MKQLRAYLWKKSKIKLTWSEASKVTYGGLTKVGRRLLLLLFYFFSWLKAWPYLHDLFRCFTDKKLTLSPDKTADTIFTNCTKEYSLGLDMMSKLQQLPAQLLWPLHLKRYSSTTQQRATTSSSKCELGKGQNNGWYQSISPFSANS